MPVIHNIQSGMTHSPNGQYITLDDYEKLKAELEELCKDRDLLQFCLDNDTFPVKDQNGAYIMSKQNEFFALSTSARHSIEFAMDYVKFKADNAMRGEK